MAPSPWRARLSLQPLSQAARWAVLVVASALLAAVMFRANMPAAFMLGPLIAGIIVQLARGTVVMPRPAVMAAQAVLGCVIAQSITRTIVTDFALNWPVFTTVVATTVVASVAIGWAMTRLRLMPGTTAVWGILPGGASVMMLMSEAYGADFRLVAFMQYSRIALVAMAASGVALLFVHGVEGGRFAAGFFPAVHPGNLAATAAVACVGAVLGRATRIPAGTLLGPLTIGAVLNVLGWITIEVPPALLVATFTCIGWNTGLRFTPEVLAAAARALPQTVGATVLLMAFCGGVAWLLVVLLHVDPLTAYLATSPGGVDAAAVIGASAKADLPFIMSLQMFRLLVLLALGPYVARWIATTLRRGQQPGAGGGD